MEDSLRITKNEDGSFAMDWDPQDPRWTWLNGLTSEQVSLIMQEAIKDYLNDH